MLVRMWGNVNNSSLLAGVKAGPATVETSVMCLLPSHYGNQCAVVVAQPPWKCVLVHYGLAIVLHQDPYSWCEPFKIIFVCISYLVWGAPKVEHKILHSVDFSFSGD